MAGVSTLKSGYGGRADVDTRGVKSLFLQHTWFMLCNMWLYYATCGDVHGTCEYIFENEKWSEIFMMRPEEFLLNIGQNYL